MTKQYENGDMRRVHIWINKDDLALLKAQAKRGGRFFVSELVRELVHNALRGIRPGQIVAYDRRLCYDLEKAQSYMDKAVRRINTPKQGELVELKSRRRRQA